MAIEALATEIAAFGFALWLGLYLIARDPRHARLVFAGMGLVAYALGLAGDILSSGNPQLARWSWPLLFLPALFWSGAMAHIVPEPAPGQARLWGYVVLPLAIVFYALGAGTEWIFTLPQVGGALQPGPGYLVFAALVAFPLLLALFLVIRAYANLSGPKRPLGVLVLALLFFGLGLGLLVLPLGWLPRLWAMLGIGFDLALLGGAIAALDAFDQGEAFLPDFMRSLAFSFFAALLFGGQVILTMIIATGQTLPMLGLLLAIIAAAIATQTFSGPVQAALDGLAFVASPRRRAARADLRAAASAVPRLSESLDLGKLDEAEFVRLTRRALSNFGNLPRLASSPLTHLPLVDVRLAERGAHDNTLERAAELKAILTESVAHLKPRGEADFGTSDEWRYFNALYFPYVVGLKVHSRRATPDGLDDGAQAALEWFQTYVPERTLFNWQNAAARLVAQDLRERSGAMT